MKPTSPGRRILPVEGTDFDLRRAALLGERNSAAHPDTAAGLDHNYVLDSEPGDKIAAILLDPSSGHRLIVATDAPGLQVYTGEYLPKARQGIALEARASRMPSTCPTSPVFSCAPVNPSRAAFPGQSGKGGFHHPAHRHPTVHNNTCRTWGGAMAVSVPAAAE